jgi:hypothetical protein
VQGEWRVRESGKCFRRQQVGPLRRILCDLFVEKSVSAPSCSHRSFGFILEEIVDRLSFAQPHEVVPGLPDRAADGQVLLA